MREIRRVLRPDGRSLMTFFLLDAESTAAIEEGRAKRTFAYDGDGYRHDVQHRPEVAVAYRDGDVLSLLGDAGLTLDGPIRPGRWRGRGPVGAMQDMLIVKRSG